MLALPCWCHTSTFSWPLRCDLVSVPEYNTSRAGCCSRQNASFSVTALTFRFMQCLLLLLLS